MLYKSTRICFPFVLRLCPDIGSKKQAKQQILMKAIAKNIDKEGPEERWLILCVWTRPKKKKRQKRKEQPGKMMMTSRRAMSDRLAKRLVQEIRKNTQGYYVPKAIRIYGFYVQDTRIQVQVSWPKKATKWKSKNQATKATTGTTRKRVKSRVRMRKFVYLP